MLIIERIEQYLILHEVDQTWDNVTSKEDAESKLKLLGVGFDSEVEGDRKIIFKLASKVIALWNKSYGILQLFPTGVHA